MPWTNPELSKIGAAEEIRISPIGLDGQNYVRAYNGPNSRWYRAALPHKAGRIIAAGITGRSFSIPWAEKSKTGARRRTG
jgi:hypothetical protein